MHSKMTRRSILAGILGSATFASAALAAAPGGLRSLMLATGWLGPRPTLLSLRGRVVLVDIFTFGCINCTNVTPALKQFYALYPRSDLAIVAVHTPEVPSYQKSMQYVAREAQAADIPWPIALDNDHKIWDAYGVSAWPTQLIFDRGGRLRTTIVGDGQDQQVAAALRSIVRAE
jgi:thiol-disulfide isomerase/thioredoxin